MNFNFIKFSFFKRYIMKLFLLKLVAKLNKLLLPSLSKKRIDLTKITLFQKTILGWKLYITKKVINQ